MNDLDRSLLSNNILIPEKDAAKLLRVTIVLRDSSCTIFPNAEAVLNDVLTVVIFA